MKKDYSWTCPYCNQLATIKGDNISDDMHIFDQSNKLGELGLCTFVTVCPNSKCCEFTVTADLYATSRSPYNHECKITGQPILSWNLKPQSSAKPFPDYIPVVILQDYEEACLICNLSPKASATLSRRCLQGIIRDFWGITNTHLFDAINELQSKIDPTTWKAIHAVRSIGNIGAHMEKDINLIVDVDPTEAVLLIQLIEVLLGEWYIRRYERDEHMNKIIIAAQTKADEKKGKIS